MKTILFACALLFSISAVAQKDSLPPAVYSWSNAPVVKTATGESRKLMDGSTLDNARLEMHTSTLLPGLTNHPPRAHSDREEIIIIKEGQLQLIVNENSKILGPGGLALINAGDLQSFRNPGNEPVTYYVISFTAKAPVNMERGKQDGGSFMVDWKDLVVKTTEKGESRPIFDKKTSMFPRFEVHATALNAGNSSHAPHTHRAEEIILMIKGNGEMLIGETSHKAKTGDAILVSSQIPHAFTNTGKEQCGYYAIQWHHE